LTTMILASPRTAAARISPDFHRNRQYRLPLETQVSRRLSSRLLHYARHPPKGEPCIAAKPASPTF